MALVWWLLPSMLPLAMAAPRPAAAMGSGFCHVAQSSTGDTPQQWLSCPLAGMERGLTIGVNHVENCDRTLLPGNSQCDAGSFGPVRHSPTLGLFCPWFCNSFDKSLNASAYFPSTVDRWGSSTSWANATAVRMRSWGFNTVGCWSSPLLTAPPGPAAPAGAGAALLYGYPLDMLITPYEHRAGQLGEGHQPAMPVDIWSPQFAARCDTIAATEAAPRKDDPRLLGYWTDNEVRWSPALHPADDLLSSVLLRLHNSTGSSASLATVTQWLSSRYNGSLAALNSHWLTNLTDWAQLPIGIPYPHSDARQSDGLAFVTYYSDVYHSIAAAAIRKHDPNHLIMGSRYNAIGSRVVQAAIRGAASSTDFVDVHVYGSQPQTSTLRWLHNISGGKPLLMSEFGFRARDSGLPDSKGVGPLLMTQTERAASFRHYIRTLVGLPFVIGYHMFMWADEPSGGQLFGANSNFGLVHLSDDPYQVLTEAFGDINALASSWHEDGPEPFRPPPPSPSCTAIAGLVCHQGTYCAQAQKPPTWAYNGPDKLSGCAQQCARLNCSCMMLNAADRPPLHPACRVMQGPVVSLSPSEFGYTAYVHKYPP
jgi:hypothetical protein